MNKGLERRIARLEDAPAKRKNPVEFMTDKELESIIGISDPSDEELEKIAAGAEILIIDDISREEEP